MVEKNKRKNNFIKLLRFYDLPLENKTMSNSWCFNSILGRYPCHILPSASWSLLSSHLPILSLYMMFFQGPGGSAAGLKVRDGQVCTPWLKKFETLTFFSSPGKVAMTG